MNMACRMQKERRNVFRVGGKARKSRGRLEDNFKMNLKKNRMKCYGLPSS
jgi:hypothetical protein